MGKLGIKAKLYLRLGGSHESPTWTEATCVADGTLNRAWDEAAADSRVSRVHAFMKSMMAADFTGNVKNKPGDACYEAIMDALGSDDVLDCLVLDGDKEEEGVRGVRFDGQVFQGNEDQAMGNVLYEAVTIKPTDSDNLFQLVKVTGGNLTYATPGEDGADYE